MDGPIFVQLYKSMVIVHLEYAHTVWYPINTNDRDHLEKVQRRAAKALPRLKICPKKKD